MKLKNILVSLIFVFTSILPAALQPMLASAQASSVGEVCSSLQSNVNSGGCSDTTSNIQKVVKFILDVLTVIVGLVAIIMIIVAGLKFITSSGESQKVAGAKNTLIFALVGLVIVAVAQLIVHFVLTAAGNAASKG